MHSQFNIVRPDQGLAAALQHKIDRKTKPLGALGQLEVVAKQIGLIQQSLNPQLTQPQMLVFAGAPGAARAGTASGGGQRPRGAGRRAPRWAAGVAGGGAAVPG